MSKQTDLINVTDAITVDGSNNVGIGIASPAAKLDVSASSGTLFRAEYAGIAQLNIGNGGTSTNYYDGDTQIFRSGTGTERMRIDATGAVTMPHQPAFLVTKNSDQNNIATGSEVTVTWQAEVFDQNSDFASNVFTAPVTGKYLLTSAIRVDNLDTASNYYNFLFTTSNRVYRKIIDYGGLSGDPVYWFFSLTAIADMDAGDTASVKIYQNNGTAQMDIIGDVTRSYFSGYLVA